MTDQLHRTPEWERLKRSGFFVVHDQPGQISLSRVSPAEEKLNTFRTIGLICPFAGAGLGILGGIAGIICGLILGLMFGSIAFLLLYLPGKARIGRFVNRVIFTPEDVYFFTGTVQQGSLPRESMQQIVPDRDEHGLRTHKFVADVGYIWAFPMSEETEQLLMNNILMAAFKQPVHLDLIEKVAPAVWVANATAPQIDGL